MNETKLKDIFAEFVGKETRVFKYIVYDTEVGHENIISQDWRFDPHCLTLNAIHKKAAEHGLSVHLAVPGHRKPRYQQDRIIVSFTDEYNRKPVITDITMDTLKSKSAKKTQTITKPKTAQKTPA